MAVGEAGHQLVRRDLPDVPGGDDDALRVVVPEPEDRVGKLELIAHVRVQRRQADLFLDLEDCPVARIHFHLRVAGVDEARVDGAAFVHQLDRRDLARLDRSVLAERDDAVLDGDEVTIAEVARRSVAARSFVVVRVELDEALATIANEVDGQQPHLAPQLAFHVLHDCRAIGFGRVADRQRIDAGRAGRCRGLGFQPFDFSAEGGDFFRLRTGARREEAA